MSDCFCSAEGTSACPACLELGVALRQAEGRYIREAAAILRRHAEIHAAGCEGLPRVDPLGETMTAHLMNRGTEQAS